MKMYLEVFKDLLSGFSYDVRKWIARKVFPEVFEALLRADALYEREKDR